ncbi:cytochrome b/b6 domain-containing protein [Aliiroseovarius sp.]|uniref:cytochrome b n=1 Tax=Aliiroseovarius sp. TaxID=1872442 RepID=UPI00260D474E|nr:cytochrome b/b6 domain-containing protein [Aliiroseovarius sp.]
MTRYHPLLVTLHWLMAVLIIVALLAGNFILAPVENSDPAKMFSFRAHMSIGLTLGLLVVLRLITRLTTAKPPHADTGSPGLNLAGQAAHWGLYLLIFVMVGSGVTLSQMSGLGEIVFFGADTPMPADFDTYASRRVHGAASTLLGLLILAHVAGWAYHQIALRDGLIRRMWFGNRGA